MIGFVLLTHLPAAGRRLQALVVAAALAVVLVATAVAHPAAAEAPTTPAPPVTISTTQDLQQIVTALRAVTAGQSIQIVDPATQQLNGRTFCTIGVSLTLYALAAGAVAYIAATGAPVLILGVAIPAGTLAGLAAAQIDWSTVYTYVDQNVCSTA